MCGFLCKLSFLNYTGAIHFSWNHVCKQLYMKQKKNIIIVIIIIIFKKSE